MSNVLALDPVTAESENPSHRRLRLLSPALKLLFTTLLILLVLYLIAAIVVVVFFSAYVQTNAQGVTLFFGPHGEIPPAAAGMVRFSDQPVVTRITGVVDVAIAMVPIFFIFWHLRGLFALYAAGTVFARENAIHLKRIGIWLIVYPFAKFAANMLFRMAGGLDHAWFHMMGLQALVLGLIVVAIAQVMEFGHEIEQEKDSFI
jgi:Ca2+/Na+ antiporter